MSTAREVRRFAGPFVQRHEDLVMIKRDILRIPVDHYMAGIRFQVPAHRGEILPRWQVAYLFAPPPSFGGGFAGAMDAAW